MMQYKEFYTLRQQFEEAASQLTKAWQESGKPVKADFPKGFIRPLKGHYSRWPYLDRDRKRTVASVIQLCDVNRWNLNMWDIGLTAGALLEWQVALPVIAVLELLAYEVCVQSNWVDDQAKFKKCVNILNSRGIINHKLCGEIHDLREYRNNIHLYLMEDVQMYEGKPRRYNQAVVCLKDLEAQILDYWNHHEKKL